MLISTCPEGHRAYRSRVTCAAGVIANNVGHISGVLIVGAYCNSTNSKAVIATYYIDLNENVVSPS
jgi:hypothetical protein